MGNADIYTLLKETVDPMIEMWSPDEEITSNELISLFDMELIEGVQQPESAEIDVFAYKSFPAINVGDSRAYRTGNRTMDVSKTKAKFFTQQVVATEDEIKRVRQNSGSSLRLVEGSINDQLKRNNKYYIKEVVDMAINGLEDGDEEDANVYKMLGAGPASSPTLANPYDLNATPGTALDLSAYNFSGTNQTANAIVQLINELKTGFVKIDTNSNEAIPFNTIYLGVPDLVYEIFDSNHDIRNGTTGERDQRTMKEQLAASNIILVKNQQFDPDYTSKTTTTTSTIIAFADPQVNCKMFVVPDGMGEDVWTDWDSQRVIEGELTTIQYEKHKSKEIGFWPQAYWVASSDAYYKMVFCVTITPYENS